MILIKDPNRSYHVALDAVQEFEESIARAEPEVVIREVSLNERRMWGSIEKARLARIYTALRRVLSGGFRRAPAQFAVMMGVDERKIGISLDFRRMSCVYLFDAWPSRFPEIVAMVQRFGISCLLVSSSQAAATLSGMLPAHRVEWIPEGIDPACYHRLPMKEKTIDVVQLGRRHEAYHEAIVGRLASSGLKYYYESTKGKLAFPSREDFIDGLARTKVSLCFPSATTHPDRAGGLETMTLRYLQSIVAGCVVVGHAPREMVELFGYNPVVEVDYRDPAGQLVSILDNVDSYSDLVARNIDTVMSGHTWEARWKAIRHLLSGIH